MLAFVAHPLAEIGQLLIAGIDDDRVKVGVDDDQIAFLDDAARVFGADHCRQSEAAREDRRVRRRAAELGDESGKVDIGAVFQVQHVGRREVLRNQYQALTRRQLLCERDAGGPPSGKRVHDALDHLPHVGRPLAQIFIVDRIELLDQLLELDRQRPFRVDQPAANQIARRLGEQCITEDQPMQVQKRAHFTRRVASDARLQLVQLLAHNIECRGQSADFVQYVTPLDRVLANVELRRREQMRTADGNPACDAASDQRLSATLSYIAHPSHALRRSPIRSIRRSHRPPAARRGPPHRPSRLSQARQPASSHP